jgi:putative serine protease PepD
MKGMDMPRNRLAAVAAAAALAGGGVGAGAVALTHDSTRTAVGTTTTVVTSGSANVANNTLSVGQIAKTTTKSVVEIDATSGGSSSLPFDQGSQSSSAEGTGFVYDAKGDIVTNEHVVDGATSLTVKLSDGSTYKATLVGSDASTDVAVIHVNASSSKLAPLTLADSGNVSVGDGVVAIGNPFGLDGTVTAGIVSALGREITAPDNTPIEGAIQTDAAINHGNSGGPLLNMKGQVIGITSQIQSDSGGNDGVGFAVPSNTVRTIVTQLLSSGKVQHALLGVTPTTATDGVKVSSVVGAAKAAGVKVGDVITGIDSTQVTSSEQLRAIIAGHKPGDKVTLTVRRNGGMQTLQATLGSRS